MGLHRHARAKQRRQHVLAEQWLVTLVVRMRDERDARGQQLGTGRLDLDGAAVGTIEPQAVIRPFAFAIFELGLSDRRLEVHVPQRGRLELVGQPSLQR